MKENWIKPFVKSAGFILLVSALTRFLICIGSVQVLSLPEPLLGIPVRYTALMIGSIELAVALVCLFGRKVRFQIGCLVWLATNYAVYRVVLVCVHYHVQGTGIGSLTNPLHFSRGYIGYSLQLLPLGLLIGGYAALIHLYKIKTEQVKNKLVLAPVKLEGGKGSGPAVLVRFQKISCVVCGGHVEYPTNLLGEKIPCPHCQTVIILKRSENIKMSCSACDGHVEFPAHGMGQTIACPHCATPIILK